MTLLLILSYLKKGWEYLQLLLVFLLKHWYLVVIAILLIMNTSLRNNIQTLQADKAKLSNDIVLLMQKQKQDLLEAEKKAQEKQIVILEKQKQVEVDYSEKIKALNNDVISTNNSVVRLQQQLTSNTSKLSSVTNNQIEAYTKSLSNVLEDSVTKYRDLAGEADTKRLAEERCVGLYNALVDGVDDVDNPDTNNKE